MFVDKPRMDPKAIVTLGYAFAAIFALVSSFAWLRLVNRRRVQSSAGSSPDLRGLSDAATATALAMFCAGASYLYSLII